MKIFLVVCMMLVLGKPSESRPRYDTFADLYSSMGDLDWGKRSGNDNWISPMYGYSSMADTEWGWKKRSVDPFEEEIEPDDAEIEKHVINRQNSYNIPYQLTLASSSYVPYTTVDEPPAPANTADVSQPKNKRNLASLARENGLPSRFRTRRVDHSVEKDPLTLLVQHYNLLNGKDFRRDARSGISSLARSGGLRHHSKR